MSSQKTLVDEVVDLIYKSRTMEYLWSQKTDDVRHTGIVIKFDYTPKYSLDYGADFDTLEAHVKVAAAYVSGMFSPLGKMQRAISKMILNGKVTLSEFSACDVEIIGKLVELPLKSQAERENAVNLFTSIKRIDAGDFKLMENNCRTYVVTVVYILKTLPEFNSEDFMEFEEKMQTLRSGVDEINFHKCWEIVADRISGKKEKLFVNEDEKQPRQEWLHKDC